MSKTKIFSIIAIVPIFLMGGCSTSNQQTNNLSRVVTNTVKPIMKKYEIPGMAVAVIDGNKAYFFNYGITSKQTKAFVTNKTLFEIGSVSKTFTATLLSSLILSKQLSLKSKVGKYMPQLDNTAIGNSTLVQLATHTSGVPLFAPQKLKNQQQLIHYLQTLKIPHHLVRIYSNIGIGLLGILMEQKTGVPYQKLLSNIVLNPLGLKNTFVHVPPKYYSSYAEGYNKGNKPIRTPETMLLPAAYGIKSCTYDLAKYVQASLKSLNKPEADVQKAIYNTHFSYYKTPYFEQGLVWEQYPYPVALEKLILGNGHDALKTSAEYSFSHPQKNVWINKTGSTDGFSTYVVFIPSKNFGFVLLANKYFPNEERVKVAYKILSKLKRPHIMQNSGRSISSSRMNMQRIIIFGNSGSGKSTLAKHLSKKYKLAHLDLDLLAWNEGNPSIRRPIENSKKEIDIFLEKNKNGVIEGCYSDLLKLVVFKASKMIFLNPGDNVCIKNCKNRPWEPHKYKSIEEQNKNLEMLIDWIKQYSYRDDEFSFKAHRRLFDNFRGSKIEYTENQQYLRQIYEGQGWA